MRGTTTAAVVTATILAVSGCATPGESAAPVATAAPAVTISGLDEATATTCGIAGYATHGEDGYDLDVATGRKIVTVGKQSKSTLITANVNVLELAVRNAEGSAGQPAEAAYAAEVRTAILKVQTVCQNVGALTASIQQSPHALDKDADKLASR
ncbi:hypothetical protein [Actinoplanes utahensis]|uniref:Lipoprotein n=1 Tax=Actinoplanes utahensis TaxID=1869 RepID=A0A0A6USW8_ACTUT|nr:hypothetical protein [Actinoplanes utahensis]KHD78083.1 hypothetical protein MB27_06185 [Actinoplanes utahensis]GIF30532.1 hypothetical protein Aut01nite_35180 [Actinoplanes utahensis]